MQLTHPKVAQPKLGAYSAPSLLLVSSTHPARMPDGPAKTPGAFAPRTRLSLRGSLSQVTCLIFPLLDSTFPLPHITWPDWPIGIQPSNRSLVDRCCSPVHTATSGKLDHQSVSTQPWLEFNSSDLVYFCWFARETREREREIEKERERERVRERESPYLWVKYEFDYPQGPNSQETETDGQRETETEIDWERQR